jgi:hypothetical protein
MHAMSYEEEDTCSPCHHDLFIHTHYRCPAARALTRFLIMMMITLHLPGASKFKLELECRAWIGLSLLLFITQCSTYSGSGYKAVRMGVRITPCCCCLFKLLQYLIILCQQY